MSSTTGKNIKLTLFGESHGDMIGITIDGLKPGIELDMDYINNEIEKRKAYGAISTPRHESDQVEIVSGYFASRKPVVMANTLPITAISSPMINILSLRRISSSRPSRMALLTVIFLLIVLHTFRYRQYTYPPEPQRDRDREIHQQT